MSRLSSVATQEKRPSEPLASRAILLLDTVAKEGFRVDSLNSYCMDDANTLVIDFHQTLKTIEGE